MKRLVIILGLVLMASVFSFASDSAGIHKKIVTSYDHTIKLDCTPVKKTSKVSCVLSFLDHEWSNKAIYTDSFTIESQKVFVEYSDNPELSGLLVYAQPKSKAGYYCITMYGGMPYSKIDISHKALSTGAGQTKVENEIVRLGALRRKKYPIMKFFERNLYEDENFSIRSTMDWTGSLEDFLFVVDLKYPQCDNGNCEAIKRYQKAAFDWISSKGVDPKSMKYMWVDDYSGCLNK